MTQRMSVSEFARDGIWATEVGAGGRVLRDWTEKISSVITEMQVDSAAGAAFRARCQRFGLGPVDLNVISASAQRVQRTPDMAARRGSPDYELVLVRGGRCELRHCGRTVLVPEGGFVLLDNQRAYELRFDVDSDCFAVHLPDPWLRRWLPRPGDFAAQELPGERPWGSALAALLSAMACGGLAQASLPRSAIADQLGSMLALLAGPSEEPASRFEAQLARLKRCLQDRYAEPDLSPLSVARDVGMSVRQLHLTFARAGTTFGQTLLGLRMAQAQRLLRDPRHAHLPVGEIAWRCGFSDQSHFARRFRSTFAASPKAYRSALPSSPDARCMGKNHSF